MKGLKNFAVLIFCIILGMSLTAFAAKKIDVEVTTSEIGFKAGWRLPDLSALDENEFTKLSVYYIDGEYSTEDPKIIREFVQILETITYKEDEDTKLRYGHANIYLYSGEDIAYAVGYLDERIVMEGNSYAISIDDSQKIYALESKVLLLNGIEFTRIQQ